MTDLKAIANRIKELRDIALKTEDEIAALLSISKEEYIKTEKGESDFSFTFLQKLSKFYNVEIIELITGNSPNLSSYQLLKSGEGVDLERRKNFKYLHLAPYFKDKSAEPFMVLAKFNAEEQNKPIMTSTHNDEEFNLVIKGSLKFYIDGKIETLNQGDSVYYNAALPHGMIATNNDDCKFLSIVISKSKIKDGIAEYKVSRADEDENLLYRKYFTPTFNEQGVLKSVDFNYPKNFNFAYDVVDVLAKKTPNKLAMLWLSANKEERSFTFSDIEKYTNKCANYFTSLGIKRGDKIMLVLKRHYEFWFAILALHKIGAIAIPATHLLTEHDLLYRFEKASVDGIVCTSTGTVSDECIKAFKKYDLKYKMILGNKEGFLNFTEGVENANDKFSRIQTNVEDSMVMFFSSGTSGYPKIVDHDFSYPLGHIVTAKYWHNVTADGLHFTIADTGWAKAVWGKLYGQWLCECAVFTYDMEKFESKDILPLFKKYNITTFCAPPTMYRFFIKDNLKEYDLSSLRHATIAGEALNAEVFEQFYAATGLKLMEGFGQTESTVSIANLVGTNCKIGSMGKPNPQYEMSLINSEDQIVKTGEVGEIVIKTKDKTPIGLYRGYYGDEETTLKAWHDGYYRTGDVAWCDEDGYFWYVGRIDDLIKSSGYRIGPFEVEDVIMQLPYILECAVTGVPDPIRGQAVKATIVLVKGKEGNEELKKDIQDYVKTHTAPYKYPRIVEFVKELPKTISGKIRRVEIRGKDNNK